MDEAARTWPDTHGRWPWVAAAGVLPTTVAGWAQRRTLAEDARWVFWLGGPALLWHQTEEWVWPGGFLPWFNRSVMGGTDEFPITRRSALAINAGLGWGLSLTAALTQHRAPGLATLNLGLLAGNAALHLGQAVEQRRYNPGLATATMLFVPMVILGGRRLFRDPAVGPATTAGGVIAGLAASVGMFTEMRRRVNRTDVVSV